MGRFEVRLSGTGGQGVILAAIILAEAAVRQGLNALQTQSYGPEARGGASRAEVIIARGDIDYPKVERPAVVLTMSQKAYDVYGRAAPSGSVLLYDDGLVTPAGGAASSGGAAAVPGPVDQRGVPFTAIAQRATGKTVTASMVAVGVIAELTGLLSRDAVRDAVLHNVPRGTGDMNIAAVEAGFSVVAAWGDKRPCPCVEGLTGGR